MISQQQVVRSFNAAEDTAAVLQLIDHDRISGQPSCTPAMLAEAIAGRSIVDRGWWQALHKPQVDVLVANGQIVGVVSYATHKEESSVFLLWMHTREDPHATDALIGHFLLSTSSVKCCAFYIASALTSGLEGLPVRHRPTTHGALLSRGFKDMDLWRYMRIHMPLPDLPDLPDARIVEDESVHGWRISAHEDGQELGFVHAGSLFDGIGVVWLIEVEKEHRRRGLGRRLLGGALTMLAKHGAEEFILYVDDDAPGSERDRAAANRLYDSVGFIEIDRLHSYELSRSEQK